MAKVDVYMLVCDECGTQYDDGQGHFYDLATAATEAAIDGWQVNRRTAAALCTRCKPGDAEQSLNPLPR